MEKWRKIQDVFAWGAIIVGLVLTLKGLGTIPWLRAQLGWTTHYLTPGETFDLMKTDDSHTFQALSYQQWRPELSEALAERLSQQTVCHRTILLKRCEVILKQSVVILPLAILTQVYESDFNVMILGDDIRELVRLQTGWDAGWYYSGVTFPDYLGYRQIWSSNQGGASILIHEFGHAFDNIQQISTEGDFVRLFESEANRLFVFEPLYRSNTAEYFAECFNLYLRHPWRLETFAPQTFNYLKQMAERNWI